MRSGKLQRRQVLGYLAAGAAGLAAGSHGRSASAAAASNREASGPDLRVINFHSHFVGPAFTPVADDSKQRISDITHSRQPGEGGFRAVVLQVMQEGGSPASAGML